MSVRGDRSVYRGGDYDEPRRSYTTVKRYQVPEQRSWEEDPPVHDKMLVRREPTSRTEIDYRVNDSRDYPRRDQGDWRVHERVTERGPERRDISYRVIERDSDHDRHSHSAPRSDFRYVEREREPLRAPSPPSQDRVREFRFERERDFSPQRSHYHHHHHEPEVERYSRETEYYQQPQPIIIRESAAPQPIIIREERRDPAPIIIREERREPQYEFVERDEVRDERQSLVRREEPPAPVPVPTAAPSSHTTQKPDDESYFYERRIREVDRAPYRDEVRPRDSASQYGSDDSYEYVRRERITEEDGRGRSHSPHHRRHLAEGALAGVAGAEILRHHRKKEGRDVGGRGRSAIGGAAVGALGAEAFSRARSWRRGSRSRSRSRSSSYESRSRRHRKPKKSRSRSKSRAKQLGGLAAVAAVGALAGYALKNRGKNNETIIVNDPPPRRSRSRRRRASVDTGYLESQRSRSGSKDARNPEHRNRRIAQAGLASAAAAGIWERVRSKSRGGKSRERSKSKVRQGVPIAAAGLGGAALAGLYEKTKAGKEAKKQAIIDDELDRGRGRHSRSRSRSRSVPAPYPVHDRRRVDDRGMIAYGGEPIYPESARGYYSDEEPGSYRRRHARGSSSGSSPDTRLGRKSRSRSRGRNLAAGGLAAGAAGIAAHELGKRRERRRSESQRRHSDDYSESYAPSEYEREHPSGYITPPVHDQPPATYNQHAPPAAAYPGGTYFPPPPHADPAYAPGPEPYPAPPQQEYNPYPAYNPADFPQGPAHQPYEQTRGAYGDSDATLGAPYPNDTFAGDVRYADDRARGRDLDDEEGREGRRGRDPGNVSATSALRSDDGGDAVERDFEDGEARRDRAERGRDAGRDADGIKTPRPRSTSRVRFDLGSNVAFSPESEHQRRRERSANRRSEDVSPRNRGPSDTTDGAVPQDPETPRRHRRRRRHHRPRPDDVEEGERDSPQLFRDEYDRPPSPHRRRPRGDDGDREREEEDSDGTVELPPRFDEQGNRRDDGGGGDLAEKLQNMFAGKGTAGKLFKGILGGDQEDGGRGGGGGGGERRRRQRDG